MNVMNDKDKMSPKERVLAVFHHGIPDRVPINYSANRGIDTRLKRHFGLKKDDNEGLKEVLGVDFRGVFLPYKGPRLHSEVPQRKVDHQWGIHTRWIENQSGGYWDFCDFPLKDAGEEEIAAWPMPSPDDYDYGNISYLCKKYNKYALYVGNAGVPDIINHTGMIRGMEQTLVDLAADEPAGLMLIDRMLEIKLEILSRALEIARGKIDFLWTGEDLGTQNTPMISLELFRKHIRPRHQKFIDLAKAYDLPVMIHSCGSSSWAFEDFIEMGINMVDTLQPEAKNMEPEYLKRNYAGRLAFHGCISTAGPVSYGSVEDVISNTREILDIMMPGGGYCFAPTHALQDNSPTENVAAMYRVAHNFGNYPVEP